MTYDSKCARCAKRYESQNGYGAAIGGRFCSLKCLRLNTEREIEEAEREEEAAAKGEAAFDELSKIYG